MTRLGASLLEQVLAVMPHRGSSAEGLRKVAARVAAAVPFAKAGALLAGLAGLQLTARRIERSAEADSNATAPRATCPSRPPS